MYLLSILVNLPIRMNFLNLTGYYIARGWAIWFVRRLVGIACCLGLMALLPIMSYNSSQLASGSPVKIASASLIPGSSVELEPAPQPAPAQTQLIPTATIKEFTRYRRTGNNYAYGHCTFYVSNRRPDVPAGWGHARSWYAGAQRSGYRTGTTPAVGAIAWTPFGWYGHVALVEQVQGDRVLISEMNFSGWNRISSRWVSSGEFKYIY